MNNNPEKDRRKPLFSLQNWFFDFVKITAGLPGLLWFRPKWIYESPAARERIRGGALAICNHQGYFDPLYLMFALWYRRVHFVCTREFFEGKKAWLFRHFLCIPVDRENVSTASIREIISHLEEGEMVGIFPEGQIVREQMGSFKSGAVLMALKSGRPIVPVYLRERPHFWSRLVLVIGERVDVRALCGDRPTLTRIEAVTEALQEKEKALRTIR